MAQLFAKPQYVFSAAFALRAVLLIYGLFQDAYSPMKYTDIDYFVFTDAARFVSQGASPYKRDTYRYTPLLAWLIYPTTWSRLWFHSGKLLFALGDMFAGWFIYQILRQTAKMPAERAIKFASIWLLNPMVAQISTRGSSEGLVLAVVVAMLWAVVQRRIVLAGILLGLAVHLKIYPFIYATSIIWWLDEESLGKPKSSSQSGLLAFFNRSRITLAIVSFLTFMVLNGVMFFIYGEPFLEHTFFYHLIRLDHRHNFSPYNTMLYFNSSPMAEPAVKLESLAFVPQLFFSAVAIPLLLAKKDLPSTMLAQTFAFVTFNKVCTSQYFLWYLIFLPFYLPTSSLLQTASKGTTALVLWIIGQALWLQQGYQLEFLGNSSFVPGLWSASVIFFLINTWILGVVIADIGNTGTTVAASVSGISKKAS